MGLLPTAKWAVAVMLIHNNIFLLPFTACLKYSVLNHFLSELFDKYIYIFPLSCETLKNEKSICTMSFIFMLFLFYGFSRHSTDRTLAQRIPSQWDLWFSKWSAHSVLWPRSLSTILFWVYRKPYRERSKPSAVIVLSIITQALLTGRVSCLKSEMGKSPGEVNNHVPPEAAPPPPLYAHHALAHAYTPVHRGRGRRRRLPTRFSSANSPLNLLSQRFLY